jgi:hypothetical protein
MNWKPESKTWKLRLENGNITSHPTLDWQWRNDTNKTSDRNGTIVSMLCIFIPQIHIFILSFHHVNELGRVLRMVWRKSSKKKKARKSCLVTVDVPCSWTTSAIRINICSSLTGSNNSNQL